jgi:hypothetical protein
MTLLLRAMSAVPPCAARRRFLFVFFFKTHVFSLSFAHFMNGAQQRLRPRQIPWSQKHSKMCSRPAKRRINFYPTKTTAVRLTQSHFSYAK